MDETQQPAGERDARATVVDEYDAWLAAAVRETEQRAVAARARVVAAFAAVAGEPVRRGSFADYHRQFPETKA